MNVTVISTEIKGDPFNQSTHQPVPKKYFRLSLLILILYRPHFLYAFMYLHSAFRNYCN